MLDPRKTLILVVGPSCVGKSTVIRKIFENISYNLNYSDRFNKCRFIPSWTTRKPRLSENFNNYIFVSKEKFSQKIGKNNFYETNLFCDNFYGINKNDIHKYFKHYNILIKDIDINGLKNFISLYENKKLEFFIFILALLPENENFLIENFHLRNSENKNEMEKRLNKAREEIIEIKKLSEENKINHLMIRKRNNIDDDIPLEIVIQKILDFSNN